jgi:hypothetical protein
VSRLQLELVVVTATVDPEKTAAYWSTWRDYAALDWRAVVVWGGKAVQASTQNLRGLVRDRVVQTTSYGVVPAFLEGINQAVAMGADLIACLHDDLEITEYGWDERLVELFEKKPKALLAGFGGGKGLGHELIYAIPYDPMQLARQRFMSNMRDAEAHGERTKEVQRVACLDGFSLVGRWQFMTNSFTRMKGLGMVHHAYDSLLGAYAAREGGETWLVPVACHHAGGMTAVGSQAYQAWAKAQGAGDQGFWVQSHAIAYEEGRGVLPLRVE